MAKYDVDRFETPPDEDLICCICQCVLDNPLESPCRHVYCKVCIETWLTNRSSCPNCRKRLRISKLKPVLPIVRNMINRLTIVCENREHGCTGGIKLEMYDSHVESCEYAPIKCLNTGCGETVLRRNMLAHEQSCKFRLIMCKKGCGLPISMEHLKKHNCLAELKESMAAMEEQYKQRLSDLETKLTTRIQILEDRIKAMEENCLQDSWGSAHSSLDDANSEDRAMEDVANVLDYVTNHMEDDDDNSFYYSGNDDDEAFVSSPEFQEVDDGDYYSVPRDSHSEQSPENHEGDDEGDETVIEEHEVEGDEDAEENDRDSDSAFFLNTDAESNNDSDEDLNDSLLDSSDDDDDVEPVQVYEVSPTSPSSDRASTGRDTTETVDEVIHMPSENSPHSSLNEVRGTSERQRSAHQSQSLHPSSHAESTTRQNQARMAVAGRISPHGNSSLGSLTVEYGSSGRSSPHGQGSFNLSDQDVASVDETRRRGGSASNDHSSRWHRDNHGHDREQAGQQESEHQADSRSGRRRHRKKRRSHGGESSRGYRKSSKNSRRKTESNTDLRDTSRTSNDSQSSSEQAVPSFGGARERRDISEESRGTSSRRREYLYGIPVDGESDSSADPSWEQASHEGSTDMMITDEFSSAFNSSNEDSSSGVYERFLNSLGSVQSSESDRTWTPGDPDEDGWETERDHDDESSGSEYQPHDDVDDVVDSLENGREGTRGAHDSSPDAAGLPASRHASSRASERSSQSSKGSRHSPGKKEEMERGRSSRTAHQPTSESDSTVRSAKGRRNKRPLDDSSSESETEEDHHPIWKRRRHEASKQ